MGWSKLNVDGSVVGETSTAIGRVPRGQGGAWIASFTCKIVTQTILHAELRALRDGISWVRMMRYRKVVVESDSLLAVQLIQGADVTCHPMETLIQDIRTLMLELDSCNIRHIKREANFTADKLAKLAHLGGEGERWLSNTPAEIIQFLEADKMGKKYRRGSNGHSDPRDVEDITPPTTNGV
ncbi:Putative ribonuclease H protein At1g65750 [Linum grandiflorum]